MNTHIDLHSHTYYSDGELSPYDLMSYAKQKGITTLALTDHDTLAGLPEAQQAAEELGIELIPGVEISTSWQNKTIHIVGLNVDVNCTLLQQGLSKLLAVRVERAQAIAEQLTKLGIPDTYEGARRLAKFDNISRNHFASYLQQQGHVKDFSQAFKKYLSSGQPAAVSVDWISIAEAVHWITAANGVAVIAHPTRYKLSRGKVVELVKEFKQAGGHALEVITSSTQPDEIQWTTRLCGDFDLFASAGSDYHGPTTWANIGNLKPIPSVLQPIWSQWSKVAA